MCAATEVTFVMVSTPEAAMACAEAAAPGLSAGKGYVDVSTVDAGTSQVGDGGGGAPWSEARGHATLTQSIDENMYKPPKLGVTLTDTQGIEYGAGVRLTKTSSN